MAKAKDTAKEAPKARTSKAKEKAAEKALLEGSMAETPEPLDAEQRKMRLKALIKLGKERGYLTYAEINDHLPDDVVDAESIEAIISTFSEMSIQVFDEAPAAEDLLMSDTAAAAADDEEVEAQAEQALSSVDSEFGRTTDPVRMYMREMGSVELLTREGEIEIAKRIEEGLKHMILAISACPTTIDDILDMAAKVETDEMRIDELVDGLIDPNAVEEAPAAEMAEAAEDEEEEDGDEAEGDGGGAAAASLLQLKTEALERFQTIRGLHGKMQKALSSKGTQDKTYLKLQGQISDELTNIRKQNDTRVRKGYEVREQTVFGFVDEERATMRYFTNEGVEVAERERSLSAKEKREYLGLFATLAPQRSPEEEYKKSQNAFFPIGRLRIAWFPICKRWDIPMSSLCPLWSTHWMLPGDIRSSVIMHRLPDMVHRRTLCSS